MTARIAERMLENCPRLTTRLNAGQPKFEVVVEVFLELNTNAACMHSNSGNGHIGLLQLINPKIYNTILQLI